MSGYALIVTEKPDAAQRIAAALDKNGKAKRMEKNGVPYYIAERERTLLIVPALGHLYTVTGDRDGRDHYPVYAFKWVPRHIVERNAKQIRNWIETISMLAVEADTFIDACDYDVEGSLIGYCILKFACGDKERIAKRMKYSTLTKSELEESYAKLLPTLDFGLIEAGKTRHEIDWLYGINLSRALTLAAKNWSGRYVTISTGRVQGPTLSFIVNREKAIQSFVPTPYWKVKAEVEVNNKIFEAEYEKPAIKVKREAELIVSGCRDEKGEVEEINFKRFTQPPPVPFDLGLLQSEAYSLFGYTPKRTLDIAQRLYLDALISYPRTSSQKLPKSLNYEEILKRFSSLSEYAELIKKLLSKAELIPNEGIKEDSAHPAIHPTGVIPERALNEHERRIWDLIIRRFMAVFGEPAVKQTVKIRLGVNTYNFYLKGWQILREGWLRFYEPYVRTGEFILPEVRKGQIIKVKRVILLEKFTTPPPRYNPGSLLKEMEKAGIGTKATRADIIQTLYNRKYIREERIIVTDLGFEVLDILSRFCPEIVSVDLTKNLEEKMEKIRENLENGENVLSEAIDALKPVISKLKSNESLIGEKLSKAIKKSRLRERVVGRCPICSDGNLLILFSKKTGKRFLGCSNFFNGSCNTSFPIPQKGVISASGKSCSACGWPLILIKFRGRRSWSLCFNPKCPSRRDNIEV
ncbi:MAG: DNA topoisomerase I [Candidatus Bathyarchaeia archaeon]